MSRKLHHSIGAKTFHAICYKLWAVYTQGPPGKITNNKTRNILVQLYPADAEGKSKRVLPKVEPLTSHITGVVRLIKNDALGCPGHDSVTTEVVMEL